MTNIIELREEGRLLIIDPLDGKNRSITIFYDVTARRRIRENGYDGKLPAPQGKSEAEAQCLIRDIMLSSVSACIGSREAPDWRPIAPFLRPCFPHPQPARFARSRPR